MKYSSTIYNKAASELQRRRDRAAHALEQRRAEAFAKIPELRELEETISAAGVEILKAIGMSDDAQQFIQTLAEHNLAAQEREKLLLRQHGYAENYLDMQYNCTLCEDKGQTGGVLCECHKQLLRSLAFSQLSEFSPAEQSTFANFSLDYYSTLKSPELGNSPRGHMQLVLDFCRDYARQFGKGAPSLLFQGETGLGKTHLSLAIAGEVIKKGFSVIYGSAQNLLNKLEKERFGNNRDSYGETEQSLLDCDLLILDDLGVEFTTSFTVSSIYNIINTRLNKAAPVIISTNLTPEELEQKYSRRVTSRIISCYATFLFVGNDIRQLKND